MVVEIVDLPIKDGDFPVRKLLVYQRVMVKNWWVSSFDFPKLQNPWLSKPTITGWWYTYPSEKYDFVSWDDDTMVPNHQPVYYPMGLSPISNGFIPYESLWSNGFILYESLWSNGFIPY